MKSIYNTAWFGIREVFRNRNYIILFLISSLIMLILFTLIPVWTVSGNSITTQLEIFTLYDYLTVFLLSGFYALFISMQVYVMRQRKRVKGISATVGSGVGTLFAGVAGTAFCASCLAPLFALFGIGFGGVIFVLEYQIYFVLGIVVLMFLSIYFTARKIKRVCDTC